MRTYGEMKQSNGMKFSLRSRHRASGSRVYDRRRNRICCLTPGGLGLGKGADDQQRVDRRTRETIGGDNRRGTNAHRRARRVQSSQISPAAVVHRRRRHCRLCGAASDVHWWMDVVLVVTSFQNQHTRWSTSDIYPVCLLFSEVEWPDHGKETMLAHFCSGPLNSPRTHPIA